MKQREVGSERSDLTLPLPGCASDGDRDLRVVMLTNPSKRADAILEALASHDVRVSAVVVGRGKLSGRDGIHRAGAVLKRSGPHAMSARVWRRCRRAFRGKTRPATVKQRYGAHAAVHVVDDVNSETTRALLRRLAPDLVVLGKTKILKPHIIETARLGILNAHPGPLPAYRGVDVVAWGVLNGDPLGVSVHWVDTGIDTGDCVAQRGFEARPGDTLSTLKARADGLAGEVMAEVVADLMAGKRLVQVRSAPDAGHLYTRMSREEQRQVHELLAERAAQSTGGQVREPS